MYYKKIKCPVCGSDGCCGTMFDWLINATRHDFICDKDSKHHFLIVELPEMEIITEKENDGVQETN